MGGPEKAHAVLLVNEAWNRVLETIKINRKRLAWMLVAKEEARKEKRCTEKA